MYLGIDIGGTKTLIALFTKRGRIIKRKKFPTPHGSQTFLRKLVNELEPFKKYKIRSIAVAIPGAVQNNYSVRFGNRREWGWIDVYTPIKDLFNCPIWLENDASLATLYEGYNLPGKIIFLTFSTGLGGGIVESNQILPSSKSFEPGHLLYVYNNKEKEWEDIAAASAIEKFYHVDRATNLRSKDVLKDIANRISLGIPDIVREHRPDMMILGGPMGKIFRLFEPYLPRDLGVKLRRPKRPTESAIYGCYIYAKTKDKAGSEVPPNTTKDTQ